MIAFLLLTSRLSAAELRWIDPEGVPGTLVICGGGSLPPAVAKLFFERAGGGKSRLVLIPTASQSADAATPETLTKPWSELGFAEIAVLHTRSREQASDAAFVKPLTQATAVWLGGGDQTLLAEAYGGTTVERELQALLSRGGIIGGTSAGAAILSPVMIAGGNPEPKMGTGLQLLPGSIVDQHFTQRSRLPRLLKALEQHRDQVGIGVDEGTAAILQGRDLRVMGSAHVTICLSSAPKRPAFRGVLREGGQMDWVALQRAARERAAGDWPPRETGEPNVPKGSLVIVGGGGITQDIVERFIELAGGPEALIVVLPTAVPPDPRRPADAEGRFLKQVGAKNVLTLSQRSREIAGNRAFFEALKEAKGLWFGGGRQWRFVDAYEGTQAVDAFRSVLERGGVIGGSSAGATIQGDYLCRASPLGNLQMMAEGYERGFSFLPGTAIDQHFSQRNRFADMGLLMDAYPQFLGIGLDEGNALIVRGHLAEVMGRNQAHFFDRRPERAAGEKNHVSVSPGQTYDLKKRGLVE